MESVNEKIARAMKDWNKKPLTIEEVNEKMAREIMNKTGK